jgi:hypothetical protein
MKPFYVFLDIDGVMNDYEYWFKLKEKHGNAAVMKYQNYPFNPNSLNNLMLLNKELQHKQYAMRIVLSSTWREDIISKAIVESRLAEYGIMIFDITPELERLPLDKLMSHRSFEIKKWLERHQNPLNYLVLDDDSDIINNFEEKHYVNTNPQYGFNDEKLQEAFGKI